MKTTTSKRSPIGDFKQSTDNTESLLAGWRRMRGRSTEIFSSKRMYDYCRWVITAFSIVAGIMLAMSIVAKFHTNGPMATILFSVAIILAVAALMTWRTVRTNLDVQDYLVLKKDVTRLLTAVEFFRPWFNCPPDSRSQGSKKEQLLESPWLWQQWIQKMKVREFKEGIGSLIARSLMLDMTTVRTYSKVGTFTNQPDYRPRTELSKELGIEDAYCRVQDALQPFNITLFPFLEYTRKAAAMERGVVMKIA